MSIIACRVTKDKIYIAADSQLTCGNDRRPGLAYKKITKIRDIVLCVVGTCTEANLLVEYIKENKVPRSPRKLTLYMSDFYKWRDEVSPTLTPEEKDRTSNCQFIFIVGGRVLNTSNLFVAEVLEFHAIGSGEDYAIGAMECGASVKRAVEVACKYNNDCGLPVQYMEIRR